MIITITNNMASEMSEGEERVEEAEVVVEGVGEEEEERVGVEVVEEGVEVVGEGVEVVEEEVEVVEEEEEEEEETDGVQV
jgi:hypothetical protein